MLVLAPQPPTCSAAVACKMPALPQTLTFRPTSLSYILDSRRAHAAARSGCRRGTLLTTGAARPGAGAPGSAPDADVGRDFASSLALMVLGATLVSERLNGQGLLTQLELDHPHIQPVLMAVAAALALAAVWPSGRKSAQNATDYIRDLAGRVGFGGLAAAVGAELWAGEGLLSFLEIETGAAALSEMEAGLAFLLMLVLVGPRKSSPA